jgi:hypothetical protein
MATRQTYPGSTNFNGTRDDGESAASGMMKQVTAAGDAVRSQAQHSITDYPLSTVLAVFGVGVGIGVVLGTSLFQSPAPSRMSSYWPSLGAAFPSMSNSHEPWFDGKAASEWGNSLVKNAKQMCGY